MEVWLDANISPAISNWIRNEFNIPCISLRDLGFREAADFVIFKAAKAKGDVVIITKDDDFCKLLASAKPPPKIIWLTFGNCSNEKLKEILRNDLKKALSYLDENDLVEISG
jgi:predicted nuclease of predicted toxin-antitoxin system